MTLTINVPDEVSAKFHALTSLEQRQIDIALAEAAVMMIGRRGELYKDSILLTDQANIEGTEIGVALSATEWRSQFDSDEAYQEDDAECIAAVIESIACDPADDVSIEDVKKRLESRRAARLRPFVNV